MAKTLPLRLQHRDSTPLVKNCTFLISLHLGQFMLIDFEKSPSYRREARATLYVSWNLVKCCTTSHKRSRVSLRSIFGYSRFLFSYMHSFCTHYDKSHALNCHSPAMKCVYRSSWLALKLSSVCLYCWLWFDPSWCEIFGHTFKGSGLDGCPDTLKVSTSIWWCILCTVYYPVVLCRGNLMQDSVVFKIYM